MPRVEFLKCLPGSVPLAAKEEVGIIIRILPQGNS